MRTREPYATSINCCSKKKKKKTSWGPLTGKYPLVRGLRTRRESVSGSTKVMRTDVNTPFITLFVVILSTKRSTCEYGKDGNTLLLSFGGRWFRTAGRVHDKFKKKKNNLHSTIITYFVEHRYDEKQTAVVYK